jgi:hypothetical protein
MAKDFRNRMAKDSVARYSAPGVYADVGPTFGQGGNTPGSYAYSYDPSQDPDEYREPASDDWPPGQPAIMPPDYVRTQFPDNPNEVMRRRREAAARRLRDPGATEMGWGEGLLPHHRRGAVPPEWGGRYCGVSPPVNVYGFPEPQRPEDQTWPGTPIA